MRYSILLLFFCGLALPSTLSAKGKKSSSSNYCLGKNYSAFQKRTSQYDGVISKYSRKYGISIALIKSIITAESCFDAKAISPKGAQGLMQLMPATAKRFGVSDRFNTDLNIKAGTKYLKFLLRHFRDDLLNTIAAYNAGEGAVKRHKGIPPYNETRNYVSKVSTLYRYFSQGGGEKAYKRLASGDISKTFFIPRSKYKSRYKLHRNHQPKLSRQCKNRTSTRLRQSTKVLSGNGVWQRVYTVQEGEDLVDVMQITGVSKRKILGMNGFGYQLRLKKGQQLLVWECRRK